jgi:hypothetical protein
MEGHCESLDTTATFVGPIRRFHGLYEPFRPPEEPQKGFRGDFEKSEVDLWVQAMATKY